MNDADSILGSEPQVIWSRHLAAALLLRHGAVLELCRSGAFPEAVWHPALAEFCVPVKEVRAWQRRRRVELVPRSPGETP
jgi:hypothetical protein